MECSKRINLIENESDVNESAAETEELEIYHAVEGESLMIITDTPLATENKWLRDNIFRSKGTVNGQECTIVIDGGSC